MSSHDFVGQWWYPGTTEKYSGTLKTGDKKLELFLNHGPVAYHVWDRGRSWSSTIFGETSDGRYITLLGCSLIDERQALSTGYMISTVRASEAYIGIHYDEEAPPAFSSVIVTFDNGPYWVRSRPYDSTSRKEDAIEYDFAVAFNVRNDLFRSAVGDHEVTLFFHNFPDFSGRDFSLNSPFFLQIAGESRGSVIWRDLVERYRWLINLLAAFPLEIASVGLEMSSGEGASTVMMIPPLFVERDRQRNPRPAISFDDVAGVFGDLLARWLLVAEKFNQPLSLLLDVQNGDNLPLRFDFLRHIQVLEGLYRAGIYERRGGKLLSRKEFAAIRSSLLDVMRQSGNEEFISVAGGKIGHLNELSLQKQIAQFFASFHPATLSAVDATDATAKRFTDIRHDFTHTGRRGGGKLTVATPEELYLAIGTIRFLVFIFLLKEAGLKERDCVRTLGASKTFRWLVDFDKFNAPSHHWEPSEYGRSGRDKLTLSPVAGNEKRAE